MKSGTKIERPALYEGRERAGASLKKEAQSMKTQCRAKSVVWWLGMVAAVYEAVIAAGIASGAQLPWWVGAIGVAMSTVLIYANNNNPSLSSRDTE